MELDTIKDIMDDIICDIEWLHPEHYPLQVHNKRNIPKKLSWKKNIFHIKEYESNTIKRKINGQPINNNIVTLNLFKDYDDILQLVNIRLTYDIQQDTILDNELYKQKIHKEVNIIYDYFSI